MTTLRTCDRCWPRAGAKFCDACGSLIAPSSEHAEYKQVTVLFADVELRRISQPENAELAVIAQRVLDEAVRSA